MTASATTRTKSIWRRFLACRRGTAVLEFAFAAPLLILLVGGVMEIGMVMFVDSVLEGGVRTASRFGITGSTTAGMSREDEIKQIIVENSAGLLKASDINVTVMSYPDFASVGQPEPYVDANGNGKYDPGETYTDVNGNGQWDADQGTPGAGGAGAIVVYKATVNWPLVTHLIDDVFGTGGHIQLTASTVVRNEPFGN